MNKDIYKNKQGFTLIELLTVISIIALLSTLTLVSFGVAKSRARTSQAQHDLDQIYKAITLMQNETGEWPGHQAVNQSCIHLSGGCPANNELCGEDANSNDCVGRSLTDNIAGLLANHSTPYPDWGGPYMPARLLEDPWGREYFFDTDYYVDSEDNPCACTNIGCVRVAAIGSFGPDEIGVPSYSAAGDYGCDDIIMIMGR